MQLAADLPTHFEITCLSHSTPDKANDFQSDSKDINLFSINAITQSSLPCTACRRESKILLHHFGRIYSNCPIDTALAVTVPGAPFALPLTPISLRFEVVLPVFVRKSPIRQCSWPMCPLSRTQVGCPGSGKGKQQ